MPHLFTLVNNQAAVPYLYLVLVVKQICKQLSYGTNVRSVQLRNTPLNNQTRVQKLLPGSRNVQLKSRH